MKAVAFDYERPHDIAAALALAATPGIEARYVAGCQSLGPMLNLRLVQPDLLVDLTGIAEMTRVEPGADWLVLGACVTHADIEDGRVPDVTRGALPGVARGIAYRAVRNRGTIGGSLCHADPSADWVSALAALGAEVEVAAPGGAAVIPVADLVLGAFETALPERSLVVAVRVPPLGAGARWGYHKICRKTGEFAHAIGAVLHDPERSVFRAVIGAVEARPIVFSDAGPLFGGRLAPEAIDVALARQAMAEAGVTDGIDQQLHLAALRRAAAAAVAS